MRPLSLGHAYDRTIFLATTQQFYEFPEPKQFARGAFDQVWPTGLSFLTACVGVSLVIYLIKSLNRS